jgi:hypothetical protein
MALFFSITLCLSILGLTTLLGLKRYELKTGRIVFERVRPRVRQVLHDVVLIAQYLLPFLARRVLTNVLVAARVLFLRVIARIALFVEETLHRWLGAVEHMLQPHPSGGQASQFLREIAEHKQSLLKRPAQRRAIIEKYHS